MGERWAASTLRQHHGKRPGVEVFWRWLFWAAGVAVGPSYDCSIRLTSLRTGEGFRSFRKSHAFNIFQWTLHFCHKMQNQCTMESHDTYNRVSNVSDIACWETHFEPDIWAMLFGTFRNCFLEICNVLNESAHRQRFPVGRLRAAMAAFESMWVQFEEVYISVPWVEQILKCVEWCGVKLASLAHLFVSSCTISLNVTYREIWFIMSCHIRSVTKACLYPSLGSAYVLPANCSCMDRLRPCIPDGANPEICLSNVIYILEPWIKESTAWVIGMWASLMAHVPWIFHFKAYRRKLHP